MGSTILKEMTFIGLKDDHHASDTSLADGEEWVPNFAIREDMVVEACSREWELKGISRNRRAAVTSGCKHGDLLPREGGATVSAWCSYIGKVFFGTHIDDDIRCKGIIVITEGVIKIGSRHTGGRKLLGRGKVPATHCTPWVCGGRGRVVSDNCHVIRKRIPRGADRGGIAGRERWGTRVVRQGVTRETG